MGKLIKIEADKSISCYLAEPETQPRGAIIVIHEVWGLVDHIKSVADRLAQEGFVALAPSLLEHSDFDSAAITKLQEALFDPEKRNSVQPELRKLMAPSQEPDFGELTIKRVKACFDYLYKQPEVNGKVAVIGFCFGGTYSFSLAVAEPRLALALPFYGHTDQAVDELREIKCPIRAFYGENDERLMSGLPDLTERMKEAGVNFVSKVYPNCGHAFFNDSNRFAYNEAAAEDAWVKVKSELGQVMPAK
ncbi:MAG TPA: dienelactone hydrolase family protein [Candidatus Saccharimonadales bacterium]|nr:dienelactone hydrolase family protein [Candidatus Saccharimonadales bacterium]